DAAAEIHEQDPYEVSRLYLLAMDFIQQSLQHIGSLSKTTDIYVRHVNGRLYEDPNMNRVASPTAFAP
ncbi:hypothetical protein ACC689_35795, partial [Rhizobium ruizarguesonis]